MTHRFLAAALLAALAGVAQAQVGTSLGSMSTQTAPSASSTGSLPPAPAQRSAPSRPSTASVPSVSGSMNTPDGSGMTGSSSSIGSTVDPRDSIGGSGSAGLAAMGGGMDTSGAATREMGSGAMTDCPMGTTRKMGLCVPYGQTRKKQP